MKGKIAFVLGAAVGYVLGTRAGRERYEQIKRGADTLWNTAPVQRGAEFVREAAQTRVDELKSKATLAGKNAMAAFLRDESTSTKQVSEAQTDSGSKASASKSTSTKPAASKSQASKQTASKSTAAKPKAKSRSQKSTSASASSTKGGDAE